MIELLIIKLLLYNIFYTKYRKHIIINKEHKILYEILDALQNTHKRDIMFSEFKLSVVQKDSTLLPLLLEIENEEVNVDVAENIVKTYVERQWAHELALKAIGVSEGRSPIADLQTEYERYSELLPSVEDDLFLTNDFSELYKQVDRQGGVQWRLPWLNKVIGGLHKGDFGFIFARTNVGKSTFVASEISFMLKQLDTPSVFFFNEEAGARMKWRIFQAYFGATEQRLKDNIEKCQQIFLEETKGLFHFVDRSMLHKREMEAICKDLTPGLIMVDNIDKVQGFKAEREDLKLRHIYTWARELAKEYCPLLAVCQAGTTAENKKWLQHTDIENAHTSKSTEADYIIGIGAVQDVGYEDVRFIRMLKNKFLHGEHKLECKIDPLVARYKEL